jgi:predicted RNase H-like nuclease (RuvC/YqgF family)
MTTTCQYCHKEFSNLSNLKYHQKHAKYCLQSRENGVIEGTECKFCKKILATKYNLQLHHKTCSEKKVHKIKNQLKEKNEQVKDCNEEIKILKLSVKKLKDKNKELEQELEKQKGMVEGMQKAPDKKTIYNTQYVHPKLINLPISNIPALTQEFIEQKVNDGILTYEKAARGYSGMLEVICDLISHETVDGVVERNYVCTDVSRNSFHRLLKSKKWKADKGGRYLNSMLDTFQEVMEEYKEKVYNMYSETPHDSPAWRQVDWERKSISKLYSGVVCREGTEDREELVNSLRKDISKRAYV